MKTNLFFLLAMAISASFAFTACDNFDEDKILQSDEQTLIEQNVPSVSAEQRIAVHNAGAVSGNIPYNADALMNARCTANGAEISASGNSISYRLPAIASVPKVIDGANQTVTLTRDIECYLEPSVRTKYTDYGYFAYPIRIRQYGSYTQYLTADDLTSFTDKVDINDQYYAKGTVVAVSGIEEDGYPLGKYPVNPTFFYDRGAMPSKSEKECKSNLNEKFVTVTVAIDGKNIKFLVNDLARDSYMDAFAASLHTGAEVEISLYRASWNQYFDGIININPFAFFVK